jgi:hypothetical protein
VTAISLTFLVVCVFGAFAYGSATLMAVRQVTPVWGTVRLAGGREPLDRVSLTMFTVCTAWFALNAAAEFRLLSAATPPGTAWVEVAVFVMAFIFPPLIMHVVFRETSADDAGGRSRWWRRGILAMYAISPAAGAYLVGAALGVFPQPPRFERVIAFSLAALYTTTSVYSTLIMLRGRRHTPAPRRSAQHRVGNAMLSLFFLLTVVFLALAIAGEQSRLVALFSRLSRLAPLLFLVVAMYFENRFDFYDLVIKRGVMLVATVAALGAVFALVQPVLDSMPRGAVRPWLTATLLLPVAMALPWLARQLSSALDRLWFGRAFTSVDAVKHLLAAMQPATDESSLLRAAEQRLAEIVNTPVAVLLEDEPAPAGVEVEARTPSGGRVRFAVQSGEGLRRLLSEDLQMLRSLASVFGFMLETIRLQQKRQEQELVARDLRLQASRSELKALRAQINPHFFFNALNAIASLIHTAPARADEAVEQLAEVFRYTLRRSDSEWAPLDQELAFARAYLDVEQARFGPRLTCHIDSDHVTPPPLVPSMLLQTLIENAVKHGVSQTRGPGRIEVVVRCDATVIAVEVRDNGPGPGGAPPLPRGGTGFGLRSVRERLSGHFGDRAQLTLERDAATATTIARIVMPVVVVSAPDPERAAP